MTERPREIRCDRCGVSVPADKVNLPARCNDKACPLNKEHK